MTSPREALAEVLAPLRDRDDLVSLAQIATNAGITPRQMANAIHARPVSAIAHLRLCAALGVDPLPQIEHPPVPPADFDFGLLSLGLRLQRRLNGQTQRQCAESIGTSAKTVNDLEKGIEHGIGVVLRTCEFIGVHPFGYFRVPPVSQVSREKAELVSFMASTSEAALEGSPGR